MNLIGVMKMVMNSYKEWYMSKDAVAKYKQNGTTFLYHYICKFLDINRSDIDDADVCRDSYGWKVSVWLR